MLLAAIALFLLMFVGLWAVIYRLLPPVWRGLTELWASLAQAILRRERFAVWYERGVTRLRPLHPYRTLLLILGAGFVVAAMTGAAFLQLAELMRDQNPQLERLDHAVWRSAREVRSPGATWFFLAFTYLGTGVGLGIVVLTVAIGLVLRGHPRWATFLVITAAGNWLLNDGLKLLFARARPDMADALWRSTSYAFPSGHAMGSVAVFGALAYLSMHASARWRVRSAAVALALCLVGAISLSRIYLGVHWLSDILAGVSAGMVWLATTTAAYEVYRRMRLLRTARAEAGTTPRAASPGAAREPSAG
jgi:undecaprenyl-diphosphatase